VLLSGDAEGRGLGALLGLVRAPLRLLLAPHHGSETPLLGALLAAARPAEVWISTGQAPPILPELERRALAARWTGRDGPVALFLPEPGISSGVSARSSERRASPDRPGASKR
jgi:beta-lactamase superfamily II metal-dependent hydrolase